MAKPDRILVQRVMENFVTAEDVDYFFDNLTSPDWIEPLAAEGLFGGPPAPIEVDGGFQLPPWSAMRYLARVAATAPDQVRTVIRAMPETDNARVHHDFADAVLSLPTAMAVEFVPRMIDWLKGPFQLLLPSKLAELLRRLATAGFADPAIALATALFDVRVDPPAQITTDDGQTLNSPVEVQPLIDHFQYERLLTESMPDFIRGTGSRGLEVLLDLLDRAMTLEGHDPENRRQDYSFVWRPAIEPHTQNSMPSTRASIVTVLRDAALQLAQDGRDSLAPVVAQLETRSWSVFHRVALDLIRVAAPKRSGLVSRRLTDTAYLYDSALHHEFWTLLRGRFAGLTQRQQRLVLKAIQAGPPVYEYSEGPYGGDGNPDRQTWQARMLAAISDDLPQESRAWFDQLVAENRLDEHPDFLSYVEGWVGPTSPLNQDEFAAMSPDELVTFLKTWTRNGNWNTPSPEGLGQMLEGAVRDDPARYAELVSSFDEVPPTYINSILQGFRTAAVNGRVFAWEPVLQLVDRALRRSTAEGSTEIDGELEIPWIWSRNVAARLLDVGFNDGLTQIPFELRDMAWSVLRLLCDDPDPTPESEERFGGDNMDPSELAINTVRGQSISAVIKYAVFVHRQQDGTECESTATGFDRMPEARDVLDRHLDVNHDPSYAVHSVYGQWFPWLGLVDELWAEEHVSNIFPADEELSLYWEAAWEAYVRFCRPYDSVLHLLKDEYRRAIDYLARQSPNRKHPMQSRQSLVDHLMVFYLRARLSLEDDLLQHFFGTAPVELRAVAVRTVGRSLYTIHDRVAVPLPLPPETELVGRAVALWETRIAAVEGAADTATAAPEVAEFGWWFISPTFDPEWALGQLIRTLRLAGSIEAGHGVAQRLAELVAPHPEQVLEALDLMLKGPNDDWLVLGEDEVAAILRSALANKSGEVRQKAEEITHGLGAKGYRQFRSLLRLNNHAADAQSR